MSPVQKTNESVRYRQQSPAMRVKLPPKEDTVEPVSPTEGSVAPLYGSPENRGGEFQIQSLRGSEALIWGSLEIGHLSAICKWN